jgi:cellobiose transport system substrate-binding protein
MNFRKGLAVATVVAVATVGLGACGSSSDSGSTSSGTGQKVTLQMWGFAPLSKTLVATYEKLHPNIKVQSKISDYDASHQTLLTSLAAGKGPDFAQIAIDFMAEFVDHPQTFTDLRKYGASSLKSDYLGWRWAGGVAKSGEVVGIPTDVGGMAVAYRTDLFAKAGLPTDPAKVSALWPTWNEYIAVGKKYVAATHSKFVDSGKAIFRAESNQGNLKFVDASGQPVYETNPQIRRAWDDGVAAIDAGLSANVGTFTPQWNAAIANGKFSTLIAPAWMLGQIEQQAPATKGKWNIATLPGGAGNDGGSFLTVPKNAAHPKEAYEFIKWLEAPAQQLALFKENQTFPATPSLYKDPAVTGLTNPFFGTAQIGQIYVASVEAVGPHPTGPKDREIESQFENGLGRVDEGQQSGPDSWKHTISDAQQVLK